MSIKKIKLWLLRWALKPGAKIERIPGRTYIGPMMVILEPMGWRQMYHDADKAIVCGGYIYFFYGDVEDWNPNEELKCQ